MSFLKHLLPGWKRGLENRGNANAAILAAIDNSLKRAEVEALESKWLMSLDTATGEWLDAYGNIFGVSRLDDEDDQPYRERIVEYILLKRGTIPAIKDAIRAFLQDYETAIEIYEPYEDIFFLNRSKLNGKDHLMGEYYTYAVIDIKIARPFPVGVIDTINEFKPAGVKVRVTYQPNTYRESAEVVKLPLATSSLEPTSQRLSVMSGLSDTLRGHVYLTDRVRGDDEGGGLFTLNNSLLNSADRLAGSFSAGTSFYHLATYSTRDTLFNSETKAGDILSETEPLSQDFYVRTSRKDKNYASHRLNPFHDTYLHFTFDVATYLTLNYSSYLRREEPSGIYTKETYSKLMENLYMQQGLQLRAPAGKRPRVAVQLLNLDTGVWETVNETTANMQDVGLHTVLGEGVSYLTTDGLMFTRIRIPQIEKVEDHDTGVRTISGGTFTDPATSVISGGTFTDPPENVIDGGGFVVSIEPPYYYEVWVDFIELGFYKEYGVLETQPSFLNEVSSVGELVEI